MLRVARTIETRRPVRIRTSWLAAHALPPEYEGLGDRYIDNVVVPGLEQAATEGLVDAVDGFCEGIGFTPDQIRRVFDKARALGIRVKLHAEQLSDLKGAVLAAEYDALSADHLEWLEPHDVPRLAEKGVDEELYAHVSEYRDCDLYSPREKLAIEYAERFMLDHRNMGDEFWARMKAHFSEREILDLGITVGHLMAFGRLTAVLQLGYAACALDRLTD